jgi:hypothetical protein
MRAEDLEHLAAVLTFYNREWTWDEPVTEDTVSLPSPRLLADGGARAGNAFDTLIPSQCLAGGMERYEDGDFGLRPGLHLD